MRGFLRGAGNVFSVIFQWLGQLFTGMFRSVYSSTMVLGFVAAAMVIAVTGAIAITDSMFMKCVFAGLSILFCLYEPGAIRKAKNAWRMGRYGVSIAAILILCLAVPYTWLMQFTAMAEHFGDRIGKRQSTVTNYDIQDAKLARLQKKLVNMPDTLPAADAIQAEIVLTERSLRAKDAARWGDDKRGSRRCTDITLPETAEFCGDLNTMRANYQTALSRENIEHEIDTLTAIIAKRPVIGFVDAKAKVLGDLLGYDMSWITAFAFVLAIGTLQLGVMNMDQIMFPGRPKINLPPPPDENESDVIELHSFEPDMLKLEDHSNDDEEEEGTEAEAAEYVKDADLIKLWYETHTKIRKEPQIQAHKAYEVFREACGDTNVSKDFFFRQMKKHLGKKRVRVPNKGTWYCIEILPVEDREPLTA